ncbi:MAG: YggS family pyridoxal phosphate-dependent enzyme, partial [Planctomycetota bacterium]|nr:YggS family pyridoxal phosphate-dependent enzyme [Planctomycetota bacterium]
SIDRLSENYFGILQRIKCAANKVGLEASDIQLVAVTKYVDAEVIRSLYELGCRRFGESRPQALWQKSEELKGCEIEWHMIGHLQTNKVRRTLPCVSLLHSGDSLKLLELINAESKRNGRVSEVLCEVNISGDRNKHGFHPEQILDGLVTAGELDHIRIKGLMAMASGSGGLSQTIDDFKKMQSLRNDLSGQVPEKISLDKLSMGMSRDFETAIEYGATLVRVGSRLFEGI